MSDDLYALLGEWKALEAAATPKPWRRVTEPGTKNHALHDARDADIATDYEGVWYDKGDAEFIAASRAIVPRLIAAVEAVLTLAEAWRYKGEYGDGPWQLGEGPDESGEALDYAASQLRAAVRSALIGDDDE